MEKEFLFKELTFKVIGLCMEVHSELGRGHDEIIYKAALEYELKNHDILYSREKEFPIRYKDTWLPNKYYADFVVDDNIILEVKATSEPSESHKKQTINYLAASGLRVGLLVNFGGDSLKHYRFAL